MKDFIEEKIKKQWLEIVDLIANAKGIVDLAEAEKIFRSALQEQKAEILKRLPDCEACIEAKKAFEKDAEPIESSATNPNFLKRFNHTPLSKQHFFET